SVKTWKLAADAPTKNFPHPNIVSVVTFNHTAPAAAPVLATACYDGKVRMWDVVKGGNAIREINAHVTPNETAVFGLAWSPDGKELAGGGIAGRVKIWDAASGNLVREIKGVNDREPEKGNPKGHRKAVYSVAWSPDGKTIVPAGDDKSIRLWNVAD